MLCNAAHAKSENEQCYVRSVGLLTTGCVATAAARLVAMEAPAPASAASLNARHAVTAGGATAAEVRPLATSHGVERRTNDPERRRWVCRDRRREARGDGHASADLRRLPQRPTLGRGWLELLEASCLTCIDSECRQSLLTTRVEGRVDMLALGSCDAHTPVARIQRWWRYAARRAKESVPPRACHRERAT